MIEVTFEEIKQAIEIQRAEPNIDIEDALIIVKIREAMAPKGEDV